MKQITVAQLPEILTVISESNKRLPLNRQAVLYIASPPGIGKSSITEAWSLANGRNFHDIRLAYAAPTDVRGFPQISEAGQMVFAPPADLPYKPHSTLLMDELTAAPRETRNAALQLFLDKRIGDYVLPDDTLIVACGNRAIDRAHCDKLSSALINRVIQVELACPYREWISYAVGADISPLVIAFIMFRPDLLHSFDAAKWDGNDGFGSPRSWEQVSNILAAVGPDAQVGPLAEAMIHGAIGSGAGTEFCAFLHTHSKLPDVDDMLKNPTKCKMPEDTDIVLALVAALVSRADASNAGAIVQLTNRIPKEFQVLCIKLIYTRSAGNSAITAHPDMVKWIVANRAALGC